MARKQSDYLAALLADDASEQGNAPFPAPAREAPPERARTTTLLGRESALARVASGEVRQVTHTPHFDFAPSFAPDGSLYFASNRAGTFDIYRLESADLESGNGVPTVIVQGPESFYAPEASA